jgi:hypothetical protein
MAIANQRPASAAAIAAADISFTGGGCAPATSLIGTPSGSTTSQAAVIAHTIGGCSARASGFSYLGVVGANAQSAFASDYPFSDTFMGGTGTGTWTDSITAVMPGPISVDAANLQIDFNFGANGGVSATGSRTPGLNPLATGSASIGYDFTIGSARFVGSESVAAFSPTVTTGQFGTIAGSVTLTPVGITGGVLMFSDFAFSLQGTASARIVNSFNGGDRSASGSADFGSTLRWLGVTSVRAFNAQGGEIALPPDFRIGLIGGATGFDYWNEAPLQADVSQVPEPGTLTLVSLAGLAALAARSRRKIRNTLPYFSNTRPVRPQSL